MGIYGGRRAYISKYTLHKCHSYDCFDADSLFAIIYYYYLWSILKYFYWDNDWTVSILYEIKNNTQHPK